MAEMTTKQLIATSVATGKPYAIKQGGVTVAVVMPVSMYKTLKNSATEAQKLLQHAKALNNDAMEESIPVMMQILREDGHDGIAEEVGAMYELFKSGELTHEELEIRTNSILAGLTNTTEGAFEAKLKTELDPDDFRAPGPY